MYKVVVYKNSRWKIVKKTESLVLADIMTEALVKQGNLCSIFDNDNTLVFSRGVSSLNNGGDEVREYRNDE